MNITFCPLCNFRFIRPTLVLQWPYPMTMWFDDWFECPLCKLAFMVNRRLNDVCSTPYILGKEIKDFEKVTRHFSDMLRPPLPIFEFKSLLVSGT